MNNQHLKLLLYTIALSVFIFSITGCDREGENIPTNALTADIYLSQGWTAYESGDFESAITNFDASKRRDAIKQDAYNGLGWSYAQVGEFDNAISNFQLLLSITESNSIIADCYAGLAMAYAAYRNMSADIGNPDTLALEHATMALNLNPNYEFSHDPKVDYKSLHVLIAQSYFNSQEFLQAMKVVVDNVSPDFRQNLLDDQTIVEVTNDTIEVSISTSTVINGTAILKIVGKPLVDVLSITNEKHQSSCSVVDFVQGGREITFVGNPVPKEFDLFLVDYQYAPDFGVFLSKLITVIEQNQP